MHSLRPAVAPGALCSAVPLMKQRRPGRPMASTASRKDEFKGKDEDSIWSDLAFPSYLQSRETHKKEVCRDFDKAITAAERKQAHQWLGSISEEEDEVMEEDEAQTVWLTIRREAERDAAAEPLLSSFLYATILAHDSFERALAFVLSNRLANAVMLPTQLFETFYAVLISDEDVRLGALADVEACRERDPACTSYSQALLYYKGYHAIQTHRIAHALWMRGQKVMAVALQSRMSEVLAVDVHPAARLGHGILLDHGTGVVIGETAVIGNNVSLLQNVTLGGTGKEHGDRHPKISDNVLIGASATVLGNIRVGEGAQIAAGSLVLKPVPPHTMVAGSPAKPVGTVTGNPAEKMQQWSKKFMNYDPLCDSEPAAAAAADSSSSLPKTPEAAPAPASTTAPPSTSTNGKAKKKPTRLDLIAAEVAWDEVAAKTNDGAADLRSDAPAQFSSNGRSHLPGNGNGKNGKSPAAAAAAGTTEQPVADHQSMQEQQHLHISMGSEDHLQQQQQHWQQSDAQQYMFEQVTGHQQLQPQLEVDHEQQQQPQLQQHELEQRQVQKTAVQDRGQASQSQDVLVPQAAEAAERKKQGAELQGVHGGEVDATIDEAVAAQKWSECKEEPEYVI